MRLSIVSTLYSSAPYVEEFCRRATDAARQLGADAVIVAEHRDRVIGFTSMSLDYARRAPVLLAVEPQYDGRGIGVMLARCYFDWYRERGVRALTLRTEKNNAGVNALYLSLGLEIVDAEITYHASPALAPVRE